MLSTQRMLEKSYPTLIQSNFESFVLARPSQTSYECYILISPTWRWFPMVVIFSPFLAIDFSICTKNKIKNSTKIRKNFDKITGK